MPPKVSLTHPIDIVQPSKRAPPYASMNTQLPQSQLPLADPPTQTPRNPSRSSSRLTFAQQLYASSLSSSLSPMIDSQLPAMHSRVRNLPTPPPSGSPPPGTGAHFLNAPLNGSAMPSHQTLSHAMNHPSPNFNSIPSSAPPFLNPHLTNTFQTPVLSNNSHPQRHRAATYDPGTSQHSSKANPSVAGPRPIRHLITMARPPDQQSSSALSPLEHPATVHSTLTVPNLPPASSILFSGTAPASPLTPPLTAIQSTLNISSLSSIPSSTAYKPQSGVAPSDRISAAQTVGAGPLTGDVVRALQSVLLTPGTGVDQLSLQAVIQGRRDADYQRIINALIRLYQQEQQEFVFMKLQVQPPPSFTIDYQALIADIERVRAFAQQGQQQVSQLHATNVQLQQQQQQPALQSLQSQQPQPQQTAAQQYQALVQQQYQEQQQQQATQYQAFLQQQQAAAQAQQNQVLLNNTYVRPPQQQQQQQQYHGTKIQSIIRPCLEVYKVFKDLNPQGQGNGGGDASSSQAQSSFDPTSLYSTASDSGGGGTGLFDSLSQSFGNFGGSGGQSLDFLSVSLNQDNSGEQYNN